MANITKRQGTGGVGRPLTNAEVDNNFENLNVQKLEKDGSIPMTDVLLTPGVQATSAVEGAKIYNENGELVATFGGDNTNDIIIEGNINVGGESNLSLNGGDISARNLFLTGRFVSDELGGQYNVAKVGEVYRGLGAPDLTDSSKLVITLNTIVTVVDATGVFLVGSTVTGDTSDTAGVITKISGSTLWIRLASSNTEFLAGETLTQAGGGTVYATVSERFNTNNFKVGHKLKVFGASLTGSSNIDPAETAIMTKVGTGTGNTYYYWVAQFRFDNGKVSVANKISGSITHTAVANFNDEKNITLTLGRTTTDYGILIYRATANDASQAKLIDVLGPSQLSSNTANIAYVDYGVYAITPWSTKNAVGAYTTESNMVHFPLVASGLNTTRAGWSTLTVASVIDKSRVKFTTSVELNASGEVEAVHDNTIGLQNAINDNRDLSLRNIILPNGTYYTSRLKVPNNFAFLGAGKQTIIKQLPWNFENVEDAVYSEYKGALLMPAEVDTPADIFMRDFSVDGNFVNNPRYFENASNYAINFAGVSNIDIDNVIISNSVGGGIYAYGSTYLRVQNCEVTNGGSSYAGTELSPLYAGESNYLTITGNLFENYISAIDVSVSTKGVVVGNTIRNCGTGLLVYASGSMLSEPNLLMGPSNEWLPTPDTLDSDWNSINITVTPGIDYTSPVFLYLQRAETIFIGSANKKDEFDADINGTSVELNGEIYVLTKTNGIDTLKTSWNYTLNSSSNPRINIVNGDTGDFGRNNGYAQFRITAADTATLPSLPALITTHGSSLVTGESIVGLVYHVKGTTYTYTDGSDPIGIEASVFSTSGSNKFITITLTNNDHLSRFILGESVKIFDHSSVPNINTLECTVSEKIDGVEKKVKLLLPSSVDVTSPTNGATTGYATIKTTFIIAKGRIV